MSSKDLLKLSLVLILVASAGNAHANSSITTTTAIGNSSFSPSSKVTIQADSNGTQYAAFSMHASGNRAYWGTNSDPKLYYGTAMGTPVATATTFPANFSSL